MDGKPAKYLYKRYKPDPKKKPSKRLKKPSKDKTTGDKKQNPVSNRIHSNCKSNTLKANSVFDLNTGVCNLNTGKGVNHPDSVFNSNTYIDHIPYPSHSIPDNHHHLPEKFSAQDSQLQTEIPDQQSQTKLANKIGSDGWEVLMELSHETLRNLTDKNDAGLLTNGEIESARLEASQTSQRLAS